MVLFTALRTVVLLLLKSIEMLYIDILAAVCSIMRVAEMNLKFVKMGFDKFQFCYCF